MITIGKSVRIRDEQNRNFTAIVTQVRPDGTIDAVYAPEGGKSRTLTGIPPRSSFAGVPDLRDGRTIQPYYLG